MTFRKRTWEIVEVTKGGDRFSRFIDIFIFILIILNVMAVILETVEVIQRPLVRVFWWFEVFSVGVFTVEYLARIWSCVELEKYRKPVTGRIRFALRFMSVVDLMAFLPFYLPFVGIDLRFVRVLRMFRILRVIKIGRYFASLQLIGRVIKAKKEELVMTTAFVAILLILSSCLMYYCEHDLQGEVFSSIPAAMWWSVSTLTTVGYGDVYPITPLGKVLGAVIAILGIGMFALPTGIIGSGFVEEIQKKKNHVVKMCPHCGKHLDV